MSTTQNMNGHELWTDELRALSAAGPGKMEESMFTRLAKFSAANPEGDTDVVVQYTNDDFVDLEVYRRYGTQWSHMDAEDGCENDYSYTWERLAILMVRDRQSNMIALKLEDAQPASLADLEGAHRGTIATVLGERSTIDMLCKIHGEWVNLLTGIEETYTSEELVSWFPAIAIVWAAPAEG